VWTGEDEHCDVEEHHSVNVGRLEDSYLITNPGHAAHKGHSKEQDDSFAFIERLPSATKRVLGVVLAIVTGLFFGLLLSLFCLLYSTFFVFVCFFTINLLS
jgi:ABC-type nitrate/sulfonate/bicarbonate transport system permease component